MAPKLSSLYHAVGDAAALIANAAGDHTEKNPTGSNTSFYEVAQGNGKSA